MTTLDRCELLKLFDAEAGRATRQQAQQETMRAAASAINALIGEDVVLGLFCHFWNTAGRSGIASVLSFDCREPKGKWLDAWIKVGSTGLFKTEVKNWTAHSIGGHYRLAANAPREEILRLSHDLWRRWIEDGRKKQRIEKVCSCNPAVPTGFKAADVMPLLCFWGPLSPPESTQLVPYFEFTRKDHYLDGAAVFSASTYLRSLEINKLDLSLPRVDTRIGKLRSLGVVT